MDFSSLPDEKIVEICDQMDDATLSNFIQSSSEHYRICNQILEDRKKGYIAPIDKLLQEITGMEFRSMFLSLDTNDKNLHFQIGIYDVGPNRIYQISEILTSRILMLQKLGYSNQPLISNVTGLSEQSIRNILLDLMRLGYITGSYSIIEINS